MNFTTFGNDPTMTGTQASAPSNRQDSMNLEEMFKNICDVEQTQGERLQVQDSLTIPQICSQKTANESEAKGTNIHQIQRQQSLRETTMEEFLIRAGMKSDNNNGIYSRDLVLVNPNTSLDVGFGQKALPQFHTSYLYRNLTGCMSTYQPQQQQQNQLHPQQPFISKPHGYGPQIVFPSGQVNSDGLRGGFTGNGDQSLQENNMSLVPTIAAYPILDGIRGNSGVSSSISQSPYIFNGSKPARGRKRYNWIAMETKADKEKRRKINNRGSAARSRARKEARLMELEDDNQKLKKENQELQEKLAEMSKMQTKSGKEMVNLRGRPERQLRRTLSDIN